ncbi:hypothetical protein SAMN04489713_10743 [Actinomadura madurae]|uniref:Uncharacterized protein n=1 Tax=Actinomadura madurae TaxID=1993 RepID=A0A1I5I046_9ACTN|nr:hypothetical protein SAMN04489713_10743 [Actinomadura madurae]
MAQVGAESAPSTWANGKPVGRVIQHQLEAVVIGVLGLLGVSAAAYRLRWASLGSLPAWLWSRMSCSARSASWAAIAS